MAINDIQAAAVPHPSARDLAQVEEAGFVSRLTAFVLDIVIVTMGSIVFAALQFVILNFFGFSARDLRLDAPTRPTLAVLELIIVALSGLAVLLFVPAYFVVAWVLVGATPGKRILGLKVIRTGGQRLSWWRAIVRLVGYWISAVALFLGFLWVLVDTRRQGWHDKLADTIVIYTWQAPESEHAQHGPRTE